MKQYLLSFFLACTMFFVLSSTGYVPQKSKAVHATVKRSDAAYHIDIATAPAPVLIYRAAEREALTAPAFSLGSPPEMYRRAVDGSNYDNRIAGYEQYWRDLNVRHYCYRI